MSDYKRLTERSGNGIAIKDTSTNDNKSIWNAIERLAELEDMIDDGRLWFTPSNGLRPNPYECAKRWEELWYEIRVQYNDLKNKIENRTLIELPCKVNDTCYFVTQLEEDFDLCYGYVKAISIDKDGIWLACVYNNGLSYWHKSNDKRLFFNSAEAEAKLKELKGEVEE